MYMVWNGPVYAHAFPMQTVEAVEERETAKERDRNDRKGWKRSRARLRERERERSIPAKRRRRQILTGQRVWRDIN